MIASGTKSLPPEQYFPPSQSKTTGALREDSHGTLRKRQETNYRLIHGSYDSQSTRSSQLTDLEMRPNAQPVIPNCHASNSASRRWTLDAEA
jgi:hypothetical protein